MPNTLHMTARLLLCLVLLAATGCDYLSFYTRQQHWSKVYESKPRMKVLKRMAPEDALLLAGPVYQLQDHKEPLLLAALSSQYRKNEIVALRGLRLPVDSYSVFLPEGTYDLFLFADLDYDGVFERDEMVGRTPAEKPVVVSPAWSPDGDLVPGPPLRVDFDHPATVDFRMRVRVTATSSLYASLDDEFFDPKHGNTGLYHPAALMAHTQGFLFGVEAYDENKTAVLFVHGILGTPRDWKFMVEGLDRARFQPFFFYYPSGMPADRLAAALAQAVDSLDKSALNRPARIAVAAHSLGGLISRAAVQKLAAEGMPSSLRLFVSFSSPYGGDDTANFWLERMPAVVPIWRDISAGSEFLARITTSPLPPSLPFHLFFSYKDPSMFKLGESSDGVVTLRSQLSHRVQADASRVVGFNSAHAEILSYEPARREFLAVLDHAFPSPKDPPGK